MINKKSYNISNSSSGFVLLTSLVVITLITMMALLVASISSIETKVARNALFKTHAFYAAEIGLKDAVLKLANSFDTASNSWDNLLSGNIANSSAATAYYCQGCENPGTSLTSNSWVSAGVQVTSANFLEGDVEYRYVVTAWDNDERDISNRPGCQAATVDCDGFIVVRSTGTVAVNNNILATSIQETVVSGTFGAIPAGNYNPQLGGGADKNYNSDI